MTSTDEEQQAARVYDEATAPTDLPIGELVGRLSEETVRLVRDEIRLARAEMTQKAKAAGVGAGMFGGAGACAFYGFGVLIAAAVVGLAMVVALWAAILIMAAVLFVVAGVVAGLGKKEFARVGPPIPTEAVQSTKDDVDEFKRGLHA